MNRTHDGWIFTKTRKFAPDGRIQIGQILSKPFQPESALMPFGPLTPPEGLAKDETKDENIDLSIETELTALFKLWANINPVSVNAGGGAHLERSNSLVWHFDSLESQQISPPLSYVQESIKHGEVPQYLSPPDQKKSRWPFAKKPAERRIFIVTGVTVAQGATMTRKNTRAAGAGATASADPSSLGTVATGGEAGIESKHVESQELGAASNFVFAYSVNEVFWRTITHAPFKVGEVQNVDDSSALDDKTAEEEEKLLQYYVVDDIAEEPYQGGDDDVDCYEADHTS